MSVQKRTNFLSKLRFAKLELELVSSLRLGLVRDWDKSIQNFIFIIGSNRIEWSNSFNRNASSFSWRHFYLVITRLNIYF